MAFGKNLRTQQVKTVFDHLFTTLASDVMTHQILRYGIHDRDIIEFALSLLDSGGNSVVFDVGASIGNYSLAFSTKARMVYAFEPAYFPYQLLKTNIRDNHIANIIPIKKILANEYGKITIKSLRYTKSKIDIKNIVDDSIEFIVGDDFVKEGNIHRIDFIRMDAKSHEFEVINGLRKTIERFRPIILVVWDVTTDDLAVEQKLGDLLKEYQIFAVGDNFERKRWENCSSISFKALKRKYYQLTHSKQVRLQKFPENMRNHLVLIPDEKISLVPSQYFS